MDTKERCDKACEILHATNDGDDLDPQDLKLVEMAVNGFLNKEGYTAFDNLLKKIQEGYKKPWFHGVENLTIDNRGYVSWKGIMVEHYDLYNAYSDRLEKEAIEVGRRCRLLETRGKEISVKTVIWDWEEGLNYEEAGRKVD